MTWTGLSSGPFSTVVMGDSIVIYSPKDFHLVMEVAGTPRPGLFGHMDPAWAMTKDRLKTKSLRESINNQWRYPGGAKGGIFASAVAEVVSRQNVLVEEYSAKSKELRKSESK